MKFNCENCRATYQIADEKVADKTLRLKCRHCGKLMLVGSASSAPAKSKAPEKRKSKSPPGKSRPASAPLAASDTSREANRALRATSGAFPRREPAAAAGGLSLASAAPAAAKMNPVVAAMGEQPEWHVGINNVPVGPIDSQEIGRRIAMGVVDGESLVWREGYTDWRPLAQVQELSGLLQEKKPAPTGNRTLKLGDRPAPPGKLPPASLNGASLLGGKKAPPARAAALPLASRRGEKPDPRAAGLAQRAPGEAPVEELAGEATRVEDQSVHFIHSDGRVSKKPSALGPPAAPMSNGKSTQRLGAAGPALALRGREETEAGDFVSTKPFHRRSSLLGGEEESDVGLPAATPPPVGEAPPRVSQAPKRASLTPQSFDDSTASAYTAPGASFPAPAPKRKAVVTELSLNAWIAMVGAASFGITLAVIVGTKLLVSTVPSEKDATEEKVEAEAERPRAETPVAAVETPVAEEPAEETPSEEAATPEGDRKRRSARRKAVAPKEPELSAEDRARLERMAKDIGSSPAKLRGGGNAASKAPERSSEGLSDGQLANVVKENRPGLGRCYSRAIRGIAEPPAVRLDVDVTIAPSGKVSRVGLKGKDVGDLSQCIEGIVGRWRFPPSGGVSQVRFPVVFQPGA